MDDLLLLSGNDIPFATAQIAIHQPTIKEIAFIGEEAFFTGCGVLTISKNNLSTQDKANLVNQTDFDILMSIMNDKSKEGQKSRISAELVMALIFPMHKVYFRSHSIDLFGEDGTFTTINQKNFEDFRAIIQKMFCLEKDKKDTSAYNPGGKIASEIADKLRKRHEKIAAQRGPQKIAVFSRYASILAVGQQKDLNSLLQYTVYQLFDEYQRYELKLSYDMYIQAKMAGAKDLKEVDNWMKDIHP